jgi:hypothetical protein
LIRNGGGSKYHGGSIYHTVGVQFSIRGFNIPWVQFTMGFKIPYDTGVAKAIESTTNFCIISSIFGF